MALLLRRQASASGKTFPSACNLLHHQVGSFSHAQRDGSGWRDVCQSRVQCIGDLRTASRGTCGRRDQVGCAALRTLTEQIEQSLAKRCAQLLIVRSVVMDVTERTVARAAKRGFQSEAVHQSQIFPKHDLNVYTKKKTGGHMERERERGGGGGWAKIRKKRGKK